MHKASCKCFLKKLRDFGGNFNTKKFFVITFPVGQFAKADFYDKKILFNEFLLFISKYPRMLHQIDSNLIN